VRALLISVCFALACGVEAEAPTLGTEPAPVQPPTAEAVAPRVTAPEPGPGPGVGVGDRATPFSLPDDSGGEVALEQFAGARAVLLAFYPKDFTGG